MATNIPAFLAEAEKSAAAHRKPTRGTAGKANAQTNLIDILGPEYHPPGSDVVTRAAASAHGVPDGHKGARNQSDEVNAGKRVDRRAGAYKGSAKGRK